MTSEMTFEDPRLEEYFRTLPPDVQAFLMASGRDICSLGELMQVGEHLRKEFEDRAVARKFGQKP